MTIGNNGPGPLPISNPLGDSATGTTLSTAVKVTTGGQMEKDTQIQQADGTIGVSQTKKSEIGETSSVKAADSVAESKTPENPDAPAIAPVRQFRPKSNTNLWLSSSYLSHLSENYAEIAKLGKKIHVAEGAMSVLMLQGIAKDAQTNAELIMLKAQKEANMHMAMAISAVVGLAVSVAGVGLSIAGGFKAAGAKMRKNALKAGGDGMDAPKSNIKAEAGGIPVGSRSPARPTKAAPLLKPGESLPNQPAQPQFRPSRPNKPAPEKPVASTSSERPNDVQAPKEAGKRTPAEIRTEKDKIAIQQRDAGAMQSAGGAISAAAPVLNNVAENFIQMVFKPDIAETERDLELSRTNKDLETKADEAARKAFDDATGIVDAAVRAMDKLSDVIKANSINSRGG